MGYLQDQDSGQTPTKTDHGLHLTIGFSSPLTSFTAMLLSSKKAHPFNIPTKPPHHQEHLSLQEVYLEVSRGLQWNLH